MFQITDVGVYVIYLPSSLPNMASVGDTLAQDLMSELIPSGAIITVKLQTNLSRIILIFLGLTPFCFAQREEQQTPEMV